MNELLETLSHDDRFKVNSYVLDYLKKRPFSKYKPVEIKVGQIHRFIDSKVFSLYKTTPYRLINDIDNPKMQEEYRTYCIRAKIDNPDRSLENCMQLVNNFEDYDINKGIILVDQFNCIIDGQHRACLLLHKFGEDYKIKVLKLHFTDYGPGQYIKNPIYLLKKKLGRDC